LLKLGQQGQREQRQMAFLALRDDASLKKASLERQRKEDHREQAYQEAFLTALEREQMEEPSSHRQPSLLPYRPF
jgi:hypothetical protein